MDASVQGPVESPAAPEKSRGEIYEGIAFTFCKAATLVLIFQRFALPATAGLTALFYVLAHFHGKRETRCIMRVPLLIAVFWGTVSACAFYLTLRPFFVH
jgi:hypothetical protein